MEVGQEHAEDAANRLIDGIAWPTQRGLFEEPWSFSPRRRIAEANPHRVRSHTSTTIGRDVECESALEQRFYKLLDSLETVVDYCEQPVWIPYRYKGRYPAYYPDAVVSVADGRRFFVEVKHTADIADYDYFQKWIALLRFAHPIGYGVFIGNHETSLSTLLTRTLYTGFVQALSVLAGSTSGVGDAHMQILRNRFSFDDADLSAAVLQQGLLMTRRPFVLRNAQDPEIDVIRELRTTYQGFAPDVAHPVQEGSVRKISRIALGIAVEGGPPWFREVGWQYVAATAAGCPECGTQLHALRRPWRAPSGQEARAWAIVCPDCRSARTINSLPDSVRRRIRAA